jgi:outer membrane biosynthesis protein TonB
VKLLDWIKGAVGFTKAPSVNAPNVNAPSVNAPRVNAQSVQAPSAKAASVRPESEPPVRAPDQIESRAEPQPVPQASAPPVEIETESPPAVESVRPVDAKSPVDAKPPEPVAVSSPAPQPQIHNGMATAAAPSQDEIERRRGMVRRYFNDYWSSIEDKPASFAERLDGAEGYINERVAAGGEPWQLDPATRKQLGLPPRKQ